MAEKCAMDEITEESAMEEDTLLTIYKSLAKSRNPDEVDDSATTTGLVTPTAGEGPVTECQGDNRDFPAAKSSKTDTQQRKLSQKLQNLAIAGTETGAQPPFRTRREHLEALRIQGEGRQRKDNEQKVGSFENRDDELATPREQSPTHRGKHERKDKNVLLRMEEFLGPLELLHRSVRDHLKVKVWIRSARHVRGFCTGYVVAFDNHWNLAMVDVDELYKPYRSRRMNSSQAGTEKPKRRRRGKRSKDILSEGISTDDSNCQLRIKEVNERTELPQMDGTADSSGSDTPSADEEVVSLSEGGGDPQESDANLAEGAEDEMEEGEEEDESTSNDDEAVASSEGEDISDTTDSSADSEQEDGEEEEEEENLDEVMAMYSKLKTELQTLKQFAKDKRTPKSHTSEKSHSTTISLPDKEEPKHQMSEKMICGDSSKESESGPNTNISTAIVQPRESLQLIGEESDNDESERRGKKTLEGSEQAVGESCEKDKDLSPKIEDECTPMEVRDLRTDQTSKGFYSIQADNRILQCEENVLPESTHDKLEMSEIIQEKTDERNVAGIKVIDVGLAQKPDDLSLVRSEEPKDLGTIVYKEPQLHAATIEESDFSHDITEGRVRSGSKLLKEAEGDPPKRVVGPKENPKSSTREVQERTIKKKVDESTDKPFDLRSKLQAIREKRTKGPKEKDQGRSSQKLEGHVGFQSEETRQRVEETSGRPKSLSQERETHSHGKDLQRSRSEKHRSAEEKRGSQEVRRTDEKRSPRAGETKQKKERGRKDEQGDDRYRVKEKERYSSSIETKRRELDENRQGSSGEKYPSSSTERRPHEHEKIRDDVENEGSKKYSCFLSGKKQSERKRNIDDFLSERNKNTGRDIVKTSSTESKHKGRRRPKEGASLEGDERTDEERPTFSSSERVIKDQSRRQEEDMGRERKSEKDRSCPSKRRPKEQERSSDRAKDERGKRYFREGKSHTERSRSDSRERIHQEKKHGSERRDRKGDERRDLCAKERSSRGQIIEPGEKPTPVNIVDPSPYVTARREPEHSRQRPPVDASHEAGEIQSRPRETRQYGRSHRTEHESKSYTLDEHRSIGITHHKQSSKGNKSYEKGRDYVDRQYRPHQGAVPPTVQAPDLRTCRDDPCKDLPQIKRTSAFYKTLGRPVGDTGLRKRHITQMLVRGDNVVMIAICQ